MKKKITVLLSSFILLSQFVWLPTAYAGIVSTKMSLQASENYSQQAILDTLDREQTKALLQAYGVDEKQLNSRVSKLTTEEIALINKKIDELPAGSGLLGTIGLIVVILVVLDILGVADIFTFINPIK